MTDIGDRVKNLGVNSRGARDLVLFGLIVVVLFALIGLVLFVIAIPLFKAAHLAGVGWVLPNPPMALVIFVLWILAVANGGGSD
ncbi:hypothetical protein [Halomarina oriensis]|uniref:Uncharacterized protein n=1 Tax=Halomarina oriensis TaxID=671145 RepID=A0A6B0GNG0_9EURY|nr:hypothetical protein [Halomarina oriensis]MWG36466.1 hypothetical protein [Halomarina oriensis]